MMMLLPHFQKREPSCVLSCSGHCKQGLAGISEHYLLPLLWSTGKEPFSSDCIPPRPQPRPGSFACEPVACQGPGRASPSKSSTRNQEGGRSSATYRKVSPHHSGNLLQVTAILQRDGYTSASVWAEGKGTGLKPGGTRAERKAPAVLTTGPLPRSPARGPQGPPAGRRAHV